MLNIAVALKHALTAAIANGGVRTILIALQTSCRPHFPIGFKSRYRKYVTDCHKL